MRELGRLVATKRKNLDLNQTEAARLAGVSRDTWSDAECAAREVAAKSWARIAEVVSLHPNELRTRGLDLAADMLEMRSAPTSLGPPERVPASALQDLADRLDGGQTMEVRKNRDGQIEVRYPSGPHAHADYGDSDAQGNGKRTATGTG